jgi:hypothetical protein
MTYDANGNPNESLAPLVEGLVNDGIHLVEKNA